MRFLHKDKFEGEPKLVQVPMTPQCGGATPFAGLGDIDCRK